MLKGKQFFYDALDPRLARDAYLSCATCHADGAGDGRTWDFTGFGEGLRNTISLRGRAGASLPLHWSGNFDEIQDFEARSATFAGGQGLMADADFDARARSAGAAESRRRARTWTHLAAYVASLDSHDPSPYRLPDGNLTAEAVQGKSLFAASGCLDCHGGADFSGADEELHDIGTLKPSSGQRLGGPLTGIDTPHASWRLVGRSLPARRFRCQRDGGDCSAFVRGGLEPKTCSASRPTSCRSTNRIDPRPECPAMPMECLNARMPECLEDRPRSGAADPTQTSKKTVSSGPCMRMSNR